MAPPESQTSCNCDAIVLTRSLTSVYNTYGHLRNSNVKTRRQFLMTTTTGRRQRSHRRQLDRPDRVPVVLGVRPRPTRLRRNHSRLGHRLQRDRLQGHQRHGAQVRAYTRPWTIVFAFAAKYSSIF